MNKRKTFTRRQTTGTLDKLLNPNTCHAPILLDTMQIQETKKPNAVVLSNNNQKLPRDPWKRAADAKLSLEQELKEYQSKLSTMEVDYERVLQEKKNTKQSLQEKNGKVQDLMTENNRLKCTQVELKQQVCDLEKDVRAKTKPLLVPASNQENEKMQYAEQIKQLQLTIQNQNILLKSSEVERQKGFEDCKILQVKLDEKIRKQAQHSQQEELIKNQEMKSVKSELSKLDVEHKCRMKEMEEKILHANASSEFSEAALVKTQDKLESLAQANSELKIKLKNAEQRANTVDVQYSDAIKSEKLFVSEQQQIRALLQTYANVHEVLIPENSIFCEYIELIVDALHQRISTLQSMTQSKEELEEQLDTIRNEFARCAKLHDLHLPENPENFCVSAIAAIDEKFKNLKESHQAGYATIELTLREFSEKNMALAQATKEAKEKFETLKIEYANVQEALRLETQVSAAGKEKIAVQESNIQQLLSSADKLKMELEQERQKRGTELSELQTKFNTEFLKMASHAYEAYQNEKKATKSLEHIEGLLRTASLNDFTTQCAKYKLLLEGREREISLWKFSATAAETQIKKFDVLSAENIAMNRTSQVRMVQADVNAAEQELEQRAQNSSIINGERLRTMLAKSKESHQEKLKQSQAAFDALLQGVL